jgi:hypothetical protein
MRYAELSGFTLYPFTEKRDANGNLMFDSFVPCNPNESSMFSVNYSKQPLTADGKYIEKSYFSARDIERDDKILIQIIEELGADADGNFAELEIVEEKHRSW